jgi:hypothetical protein
LSDALAQNIHSGLIHTARHENHVVVLRKLESIVTIAVLAIRRAVFA